jgi:hypothetical protein
MKFRFTIWNIVDSLSVSEERIMHFTIEEHIDSLKYHNHSNGMSMLEVLEDCLIDKKESVTHEREVFLGILNEMRDILLDCPGTPDTNKLLRMIDEAQFRLK